MEVSHKEISDLYYKHLEDTGQVDEELAVECADSAAEWSYELARGQH